MKSADFAYHRPSSLNEALTLLANFGDDAKVIAGGQSLLPIMNMRLAEPEQLVDVTAVPELRRTIEGAEATRYGATTTHMKFEDQLVPDVTGGLLQEAACGIGYRAIRTRGTVGGSLAHSDSAAEWPTVMSALNATVHLASLRGTRTVPVREFLLGFFTTQLEPDELITAVEVLRLAAGTRFGLHKLVRQPGDFAESLAVAFRIASSVELWLGAARDTPVRMSGTERRLAGISAIEVAVADLVEPVSADLGIDLTTCEPLKRHSVQLHAAALHRALTAAERVEFHA